ncbi:aminotransferase class I/II-fold pyridoxal phosphate-dependent enzyme [Virgibacillus sp. NKC19-3]|uniref:aminotransferase class I/II-fold pyridoxal phosphate-dependent enzyme n=1 Tax=Virgibacillus saliphilus TaxID=2831674 RepID=UPI001C9A629B|nr:aminotransferase class I/II-fold pyridoxal phosphate-dependent enzyme [Virgibacillus sp. NKC19-3]MBY7144521.1 aminotransferase class I/II-fold pyridoxal phosphate-dependent enzyme [Virgibacillus sp. NKC19-3]
MRHLLNKNVRNIEMSGIRKVSNKVDRSPDVINLTFGQPNFDTPEYIKEAGIQAIKDGHTGYTETAGLLELREAACHYMNRQYNLTFDPNEEVLVTVGASEALDITFRTILNEGSEVIIPTPAYPGYEPLVQMCNGVSVYVDTTSNEFKLTANLIEKHLTDKTRAIVLPYPNNPMGSLLTKSEIRDIADLLAGKEIFIVADEIYSELNFEEDHMSIGEIDKVKNQSIIINGLSKSLAMTGWRIGFAFAPNYLIEEFNKIKSFNTICAPSISQYASVIALKSEKNNDEVLRMKIDYKKRRDYVYNRIVKMGLEVIPPNGAFYIFPSIKKTGLSSTEFMDGLLEEENVAIIPGNAFTEHGEGFIRISYAQSFDQLEKGLDGIERFVSKKI